MAAEPLPGPSDRDIALAKLLGSLLDEILDPDRLVCGSSGLQLMPLPGIPVASSESGGATARTDTCTVPLSRQAVIDYICR